MAKLFKKRKEAKMPKKSQWGSHPPRNQKGERFIQVILSPEDFEAVQEYRHGNRIISIAEACRRLIRLALALEKEAGVSHDAAVFPEPEESIMVWDLPLRR